MQKLNKSLTALYKKRKTVIKITLLKMLNVNNVVRLNILYTQDQSI